MMKLLTSLLTLIIFSGIPLGNADIYRWVDENGNYHFGASPPTNAKTEVIKPAYTKPSNAPESDSGSDSGSAEQSVNNNTERKREYDKHLRKLEKERQAYCEKAQTNKKNLLNNPRVMLMSNNGEARMLSHEEKLEQLRKADEQIDQFCGE